MNIQYSNSKIQTMSWLSCCYKVFFFFFLSYISRHFCSGQVNISEISVFLGLPPYPCCGLPVFRFSPQGLHFVTLSLYLLVGLTTCPTHCHFKYVIWEVMLFALVPFVSISVFQCLSRQLSFNTPQNFFLPYILLIILLANTSLGAICGGVFIHCIS